MRAGKIRFWNDDRGYGFIMPDDGGTDMFVHISNVRSGSKLAKDDRVTFQDGVSERTGKSQAERVTVQS
jgi:cold shock protein